MSDDLIMRLRALAAELHHDVSIAVDAVIEIKRLSAEAERLRAENAKLRADVGRLLVVMRKMEQMAAESYLPHEIVPGSNALEGGR